MGSTIKLEKKGLSNKIPLVAKTENCSDIESTKVLSNNKIITTVKNKERSEFNCLKNNCLTTIDKVVINTAR